MKKIIRLVMSTVLGIGILLSSFNVALASRPRHAQVISCPAINGGRLINPTTSTGRWTVSSKDPSAPAGVNWSARANSDNIYFVNGDHTSAFCMSNINTMVQYEVEFTPNEHNAKLYCLDLDGKYVTMEPFAKTSCPQGKFVVAW